MEKETSIDKLQDVQITFNEDKLAKELNIPLSELAIVRRTVAKNTTLLELGFFLSVAKQQGLSPFNKEIWCYKDHKNNLIIFTGRDGMLKKAQENPLFNGLRSSDIREKDEFSADIPNGIITHKITQVSTEKRGNIIGAYCIVFRKDGEHTIELVDVTDYDKGMLIWKSHKSDMIKKVAEQKALKKSFGFSGLQLEDEFDIRNNVAYNKKADHTDYEELERLTNNEEV
jgi:hypothetical protein